MLISSRENCTEVWINSQFAWVTSPCQGEGRVRVSSELIEILDDDPSPSSSPLQQGQKRQKTEAIRDLPKRLTISGYYEPITNFVRSGSKKHTTVAQY
jgi:hypothetical protein